MLCKSPINLNLDRGALFWVVVLWVVLVILAQILAHAFLRTFLFLRNLILIQIKNSVRLLACG